MYINVYCVYMYINVYCVCHSIVNEDELHTLREELSEMKHVRDDLRLKLRKKEWECEDRQKERDQERVSAEKLRQRLDMKGLELSEAWNREQEVVEHIGQLEQQVRMERCTEEERRVGRCEGKMGK